MARRTAADGLRAVMQRPYFAARLLTLLAIMATNLPLLTGSSVLFEKDLQRWFYPLKLYLRAQLLDGAPPFWTSLLGLGSPFAALPEMGVFYPGNLILLLPAPLCIGAFLVLHLLLAASGTFTFLKDLRLRPEACAFGALAFALSGYLLSMFSSSGLYLLGIAWMPLSIALANRILGGAGIPTAFALGMVTACQLLTGEAQSTLFCVMFILAFAIARGRRSLRALPRLSVAAVFALLLFAPQLTIAIAQLSLSGRSGGVDLAEAAHLSLHPLRFLEMGTLNLFGTTADVGGYLGFYMNALGTDNAEASPWSASVYLGSVVLLFFFFAVLKRRRPPGWVVAAVVTGTVGLLLALGDRTALFGWYHRWVVGADYFRYPEKFFAPVAFAVPIISAFGLHTCMESSRPKRIFGDSLFWIFAAMSLFLASLLAATPTLAAYLSAKQSLPRTVAPEDTIGGAIGLELAVLTIGWLTLLLTRRFAPRFIGMAAISALGLQLLFVYHGVVHMTGAALYTDEPPAARFFIDNADANHPPRLMNSPFAPPIYSGCATSGSAGEFAKWRQASLTMNTGLPYGVGYYHAYVGMKRRDHKRFWKQTKAIHRRLMDLLTIPFGMFPLYHETRRDPTLERILKKQNPCFAVYRSRTVLPLVRPVGQSEKTASIDDVIRQMKSDETVLNGAVALIDSGGAPIDLPPPSPIDAAVERCRVSLLNENGVAATCRVKRRRMVVINVAFHPNLHASVDGASVPLLRADGIVSALSIKPGTHRLKVVYREPYLPVGLMIASLPLIIMLVYGWRHRKAMRRRPDR